MQKNFLILIFVSLTVFSELMSQCPDRDSLINNVLGSEAFQTLPLRKQLEAQKKLLDRIDDCPYKNDTTHSLLLWRVGMIHYKLGDYLDAVRFCTQSINLDTTSQNKTTARTRDLIRKYFWLASIFDSLDNKKEEKNALDSCINIAIRQNATSDISCVRSLYSRSVYFFDMGDYHRCVEDATMAEKSAKEILLNITAQNYIDASKSIIASSHGWIVMALLALKNYGLAEEYLANEEKDCKKEGLLNYLSSIYGDMGDVQVYRGDYPKAISYYNLSIRNALAMGYYLNCMQAYRNLAWNIYFLHYKDADKALANFRRALWYFHINKSPEKVDSFEALNVFANMANVFVHQGAYDSAWVYFQLAFDQIRPGISETDIIRSAPEELMTYRKVYYLASMLIDKGDAYWKKYKTSKQTRDIREALRIYRIADQFLDRIKTQQSDLQSKLFWRKDSRRLYEHAIDACVIMGDVVSAFYFFERSRAILLNDQLNAQRWLTEQELGRQGQVNKKILSLLTALSSMDSNSKEYAATQNKIFDLKQELKLPRNIDLVQISLKDAQKLLSEAEECLLELFEGDSAVYTLLVFPGQSFLQEINKKDFDQAVNRYLWLISKRSISRSEFDEYISIANHLYKLIFHNYQLNTERVIISPDGPYFPFEALSANQNFSSPHYFFMDHAVSYAYSASFLLNDFPEQSPSERQIFLGFAPLQFSSTFSLANLPESDRSLDQIGGYFNNTQVRTGSRATRQNFLQEFTNYKILQLYTHSSDSSDRGEPVIYFADSSIYLSELIPESKPVTRLVVLSACETGIGQLFKGEGIFSFNRAFASLGIPAAITNLWAIQNKSMYRQTELFYKYLTMGFPTDVSLQKAKIEFLKNSSKEQTLPYFWAATILTGKSEVLVDKKDHRLTWLIFLLAAALMGSAAIYVLHRGKFILKRKSNELN